MRHYSAPISKARFWLGQAREAIQVKRPLLAVEPSHAAVHNAVIALRNLQSEERGKVRHDDVAALALRLGVPKSLAEGIGVVEAMRPPFEYGAKTPSEEDAMQFYRVAEAAVAFVEVTTASTPAGSRRGTGRGWRG